MTTPTTVNVQFQLRADTAANWTAANPILLVNEFALETDTKKLKVGDGNTAWASLAYFPSIVSGGTVLGNLEIGSTGTLTFEGSTVDGFETQLAVTDPTADRTITLPDQSGTVVVSGNASIVDADIAAGAEIAVSKLANGTANQVLVTDGTDVSWSDNLTIAGNLTVNGTTTTVNTQTLVVEDKNIELGVVGTPTDLTADGGGITLKGTTDKTINWVDATDSWTSSENIDLASGKSYRINGTEVLSGTALGSGVTSSSLTSVGTITAGTWQGTAIDATYLDSTVVTTGDTGTVTSTMIADGTIVNGDINAGAAIADTKLDTISTPGKVSNSATTATSANTASTIVARDASGDFTAGTITADLTGNAATATALETARNIGGVSFDGTASINLPGVNTAGNQDTSGNAATATKLDSARTFAVNGDITGTVSSDLTSGASISTSIATGVIVNADVNASAAIAGSKIDPDFGSQTVKTTGVFSAATGSNSAPSITFTGDLNTGIYSPGADQVAISTNGTQRINIEADGDINIDSGGVFYDATNNRLAVGTTSPSDTLHVAGGARFGANDTSTAYLEVGTGATGNRSAFIDLTGDTTYSDFGLRISRGNSGANTNSEVRHRGTGSLIFNAADAGSVSCSVNGSERARIDSSGRLLVGTSSAANGPIYALDTGNGRDISGELSANNGFGFRFVTYKARGSTGSKVIVSNNDELGNFVCNGYDGSSFIAATQIQAFVDGTPGANDMPGRLVFSVTADGASSPTEAMRIKNSRILNFANTPVYADNAAAKTGGLVDGDVYRKSDGTLMIVYT